MIEVENLTKSFGPTQALRGVSFSVQRGEIVGFLGPNGAGKTTTMKILTCFIPADSGRATVAGYDVFEDSLEVRKRVGYLPENTPLYHEMSVVDFLQFVAGVRGIPKRDIPERIRSVVVRTGLEGAVGKVIGELSKGYRQRVGLAQALIHDPEILILDEPTSGLDPNQIKEIRELIREIGKEKTIILSTHILPEVTATCDRAIIIHKGQVVASGTPGELMAMGAGSNAVTVRVRGPQGEVQKHFSQISGVREVRLLGTDDGCLRLQVIGEKPMELAERVFEVAAAQKWPLSELRPEAASLEDVFARLTQDEK
ncbi:MAG: ATP-binding cassette domain-containing protein [Candidatus Sumerlaeaceae bacterium]|nr:ATP-binding cassette domain-containing protein [Candidatus Sumerlaeaceae bacterium]